MPRVGGLLVGLFNARTPAGGTMPIIAQALATFLPLLDLGWLPADPRAVPEMTPRIAARIDLLRQERAARARERLATGAGGAATSLRPDRPPSVRPDRPPSVRPDRPPSIHGIPAFAAAAVQSPADVWNELLDLTSMALETFIGYRDVRGVGHCVALIDLLAETFEEERPEAA